MLLVTVVYMYRTVNSWSGDSSWPTYKLCLYRFACSSLVSRVTPYLHTPTGGHCTWARLQRSSDRMYRVYTDSLQSTSMRIETTSRSGSAQCAFDPVWVNAHSVWTEPMRIRYAFNAHSVCSVDRPLFEGQWAGFLYGNHEDSMTFWSPL